MLTQEEALLIAVGVTFVFVVAALIFQFRCEAPPRTMADTAFTAVNVNSDSNVTAPLTSYGAT